MLWVIETNNIIPLTLFHIEGIFQRNVQCWLIKNSNKFVLLNEQTNQYLILLILFVIWIILSMKQILNYKKCSTLDEHSHQSLVLYLKLKLYERWNISSLEKRYLPCYWIAKYCRELVSKPVTLMAKRSYNNQHAPFIWFKACLLHKCCTCCM